ncbi:MAG TPA: YtxH domain-containing protein [Thermomicrobiales bacterium]|jgi:hypothetical protein|nr:hypothetical protein [Chloroflexota bacterium]HQX62488.1 YtxH domain-containing protein [Thermomicrobiales bacterium]HBY47412.1 hypothetical protein [Chloroflexota bacterium]HCG28882.1 hypothetical protein [Chloroflexota bacterium]HQZ89686.1 YtxH domain-containing protein [Thermomicrobiales bacterium]
MERMPHGERSTPWETWREIDWDSTLQDTSGDTSSLSFVSGYLLGVAVGLIVGFALAPQSGRRMVEQVWQTGIGLRERGVRSFYAHVDEETLVDEAEQAETELMRRIHRQE